MEKERERVSLPEHWKEVLEELAIIDKYNG